MPIITGTPNSDVIVGTLGDDTIVGLSGDDSILGGRGNNIIFGNQGNDTLRAGRGQDTLLGGKGNDKIFGSEQDNILSGDDGDDTLFAIDGENIIFGGPGNDVLVAGLGNDFLYGGQGNDTLWAERGNNVVSGDRGANVLIGGTGENIFVLNINHGGPSINDADQILRFKPNDKIALLGGPEGQTIDRSAINIAFVRRDSNSSRGNYVLTNLATGEFLAVIHNVRRSALTRESFTEDLTPSDTPDPGPPQPPVVDPEDELPPAPDPGDTTTEPQPPPTDGPGVPPVIEPPVDEDEPEDPVDPEDPIDPEDPGAEDPGAEDPVDPNQPPTITIGGDENIFSKANKTVEREGWATNISPGAPSEADQTLTVTLSVDNADIFDELPTLDLDTGTLRYVPTPSSQGVAQVTLTLQDDGGTEGGGQDTTVKTFNIQITNPNSPIVYLDRDNQLVDVSVDYRFNQRTADDTPILPTIPLGAVDGDGSSLIEIAYGDEADPGDKEISQVIIRVNHEAGDSQELTIPTGGPNQIYISSDIEGGFKTWTLTPSDGPDSLGLTSWNPFLQGLVYEKSSWSQDANPGDLTPRTLTFAATDADGNESLVATKTINPVSINDPPSITLDENVTTISAVKDVPFSLEDVIDGFADPDAGSKDLTLTLSVDVGELLINGVSQGQSLEITANQTELNTQLSALKYRSDEEVNADNGQTLTITLNDNGNTGFEPEADGSFSAAAANEVRKTVSITVTDEPVEARDVEMKIPLKPAAGPNEPSEYPSEVRIPASAFLLEDQGQGINMTRIGVIDDDDPSQLKLDVDGDPVVPNWVKFNEGWVEFDMEILINRGPNDEDRFAYEITDSSGQSSIATVTLEYHQSPNADTNDLIIGKTNGPNILNGWRIEQGVAEFGDTLVGGNADDFLIGGRRENILYGGQGNDTLAGIWLDEDPTGGFNQRNAFVFKKSDVIQRPGFNVNSVRDIVDHPYKDKILTFNWGAADILDAGVKDWARDYEGNRNDIIWLSGFDVDSDTFDNRFDTNIQTFDLDLNDPNGDDNILDNDYLAYDGQQFFGLIVRDLNQGVHDFYLLYDETGDYTTDETTHIIAKFTGNSLMPVEAPNGIQVGDFRFDDFPL